MLHQRFQSFEWLVCLFNCLRVLRSQVNHKLKTFLPCNSSSRHKPTNSSSSSSTSLFNQLVAYLQKLSPRECLSKHTTPSSSRLILLLLVLSSSSRLWLLSRRFSTCMLSRCHRLVCLLSISRWFTRPKIPLTNVSCRDRCLHRS